MSTAVLYDELVKRHDLPTIFQQIKTRLDDEATRRHEFREWLDEDKKAEFINGEIVMHSPVKRKHLRISTRLSTMLDIYVRLRNLGEILVEKALISLTRNDYEPDISFFTMERAATFEDEQMLFPAPDFIVEILSRSTAKIDRGIKKNDYAAHGVREYWIIDPNKQLIEQYIRAGNNTDFMPASKLYIGQTIKSIAIKGFEIPVEALFVENVCAAALKELVANP